MDLRQLEYFVRVAELGSFTRAAQALDVAQPALSRQVRQLEVELRQTLLVRNGRGALPTEAGKLLLEHGRAILHQVRRAQEELSRARGGLSGRVAVGMPPSVARMLTVPLARAFRAQLPEAQLSISEDFSVALQESLLIGHTDIAVLYNPAAVPALETEFLAEEPLVLVERRPPGLQEDPPPPPITLDELLPLPLVIPRQPNANRMLVEAEFAALGARPVIALEVDGVAAILDLVADGVGHAVLSRNAVQRSIRASAYAVRPIVRRSGEQLRIHVHTAVSALCPVTRAQARTLELIRRLILETLA
ncbi:MAG: LysR substrate-binding domain-containing protein [Candidatus Dactylopiibacterium sp.]|nr:LysR substrate-binding domain-containing protein [Candidatus Dactylopiibacterium sp.]